MTQIDSTAQTDLGISDHEELLLPYKVSYFTTLAYHYVKGKLFHGTGVFCIEKLRYVFIIIYIILFVLFKVKTSPSSLR